MNSGTDVFEAVRRANPVPPGSIDESVYASASELFALLNERAARPSGEVLVDTASRPAQVRRRRSLLVTAAAAAVVAVFVCAVVLAVRDDPIVRVPAAAPTTAPPELVARGFVEAWSVFDADRALGYLADDADISGLIEGGSAEALRQHLAWLAAVGEQLMLDACDQVSSSATGTTVRCTYEFHSFGSDELGLDPFRGSYFDLTVRDGKIVKASTYVETERFSPQMWSPFADWMDANYPADADVMYTSASRSGLPRYTDESIQLWEQHIREFVEARLAGASDSRVGFVGLPPEGATPSTPERGELVVFVAGPDFGSRTWVYADGRLIWHRYADLPYGANPDFTGFLEQRLTPEGVELMRSEVVSLLDGDQPAPDRPQACAWVQCHIWVRNHGRVVQVPWEGDDSSVVARINDPASWLPPSAWEDPEIKAYVPSRYRVGNWPVGLTLLPQAAQDLLEGPILTTEELRALVEVFDDAGLESVSLEDRPDAGGSSRYTLTYRIDTGGEDAPAGARRFLLFDPYLPHGAVYCQHCG